MQLLLVILPGQTRCNVHVYIYIYLIECLIACTCGVYINGFGPMCNNKWKLNLSYCKVLTGISFHRTHPILASYFVRSDALLCTIYTQHKLVLSQVQMMPSLTDWARSPIYKNPEEGIGNKYMILICFNRLCVTRTHIYRLYLAETKVCILINVEGYIYNNVY